MLNYIHGDIEDVVALDATLVNDVEVEDNAAVGVRIKNGSLASLSMTLGSCKEISRLRFAFANLVAESILEPYTMGRDPWSFVARDEATQEKIDAALADARRSLELVTASYHSARTGQKVSLPITESHPFYRSWAPQTPA